MVIVSTVGDSFTPVLPPDFGKTPVKSSRIPRKGGLSGIVALVFSDVRKKATRPDLEEADAGDEWGDDDVIGLGPAAKEGEAL